MNKKILYAILISFFSIGIHSVRAEFGDADFPIGTFEYSPKSYHDAWCRRIKNECRVRFQKDAMWVEGQGGIYRNQFVKYRYDYETTGGGLFGGYGREHYNYVTYKSKDGTVREALFLFANDRAQQNFIKSFLRWEEANYEPIPNLRLPNSQGPQDTQGKDKGLNPYDNPPIIDFMRKTTDKNKGKIGNINCDSPVWKNKPVCKK